MPGSPLDADSSIVTAKGEGRGGTRIIYMQVLPYTALDHMRYEKQERKKEREKVGVAVAFIHLYIPLYHYVSM